MRRNVRYNVRPNVRNNVRHTVRHILRHGAGRNRYPKRSGSGALLVGCCTGAVERTSPFIEPCVSIVDYLILCCLLSSTLRMYSFHVTHTSTIICCGLLYGRIVFRAGHSIAIIIARPGSASRVASRTCTLRCLRRTLRLGAFDEHVCEQVVFVFGTFQKFFCVVPLSWLRCPLGLLTSAVQAAVAESCEVDSVSPTKLSCGGRIQPHGMQIAPPQLCALHAEGLCGLAARKRVTPFLVSCSNMHCPNRRHVTVLVICLCVVVFHLFLVAIFFGVFVVNVLPCLPRLLPPVLSSHHPPIFAHFCSSYFHPPLRVTMLCTARFDAHAVAILHLLTVCSTALNRAGTTSLNAVIGSIQTYSGIPVQEAYIRTADTYVYEDSRFSLEDTAARRST